MSCSTNAQSAKFAAKLRGGVAFGAMFAALSCVAIAHANDAAQTNAVAASATAEAASSAAFSFEEVNRYYLRFMTQIFDGAQDFSHTQVAGFARMRKDNESWTLLDFGDGSVVISGANGLQAGAFANVSGTELGVLYDYDTKRIAGSSDIAQFHNSNVRPLLDKSPALGSDASWSASVPASSLGIAALQGGSATINFSRKYFTYDGKPMVLVEYQIPAIRYDSITGSTIMHWGRGFALSDPGFGNIYANVALHRSAANEVDGSIRPYRFYRAAFASDDNGKAMIDIAKIPQVAAIYNDFFGKTALEVIPFSGEAGLADQAPVKLATNLDIIAMSIGENGANDNGALAAAQTGTKRGAERAKAIPAIQSLTGDAARRASDAVGAKAMTDNVPPASPPTSPALDLAADERVDQRRAGSAQSAAQPNAPAVPEQRTGRGVEKLVREALPTPTGSRGGGGSGGSGGGEGAQGSGGGGRGVGDRAMDALGSQTASDIGANVNLGVSAIDKGTSIGNELAASAYELNAQARLYEGRLLAASNAIKQTSLEYTIAVKEYDRLLNTTLDSEKIAAKALEVRQLTATLASQKSNLITVTNESSYLGNKARQLLGLGGQMPLPKLAEYLETFGNTFAGRVLAKVNPALNVANVANAGVNAYGAATADQSSGKQTLNRKYVNTSGQTLDNFEAVRDLGLDVLGLVIDVGSGNLVGAVTGGASLLSQSLSDMYISLKGLNDINKLNEQLKRESAVLQRRLREKQEAARDRDLDEIDKGLEEAKAELAELKSTGSASGGPRGEVDTWNPNYDRATGLPKPEYWAYLKRHGRQELINIGIDPDAPVGHTGPWPPEDSTTASPGGNPPRRAEPVIINATANQEYDYPTARAGANDKRPVVTRPADTAVAVDPEKEAELARAARQAQARADLEAYQAKRREERRAEADKPATPRGSPFRTSELKVSSFNAQPIRFTPVVFRPVAFDEDQDLFVRNPDGTTSLKKVGPDDFVAPKFTPATFNAPSTSKLNWTNFADDDYPGGAGVPAWTHESMVGIVATDLGKWDKWLATQDIRLLERLARQAGYPNLASALNDAANIIRLSQDAGYRQWALRQPACGGYSGCGPNFLGRWAMKTSTVKLGDLLNQSRDVFSTGGLSDIAISGDALAYMLRDFGLQDGDIVDVLIQQFGKTIFTGRVNLTNAGQDFRILLRRGVAQLTLTAVNEGFASPNTAEITIGNVTKGDSRQSYSLNTGQSATLRIETNKPAGN